MTTETMGVAALILVAVLVGAAVPALVQARSTLQALQVALRRSESALDEALHATTAVAVRVDALVARLEAGGRLDQLFEGVASVSGAVSQLKDTIRVASAVGAAVGPALAAAIQAFRESRQHPAPPPDAAPPPAANPTPGASSPPTGKQATT